MRNGLNRALRVGLSLTGVALVQTSGWGRMTCRLLAETSLTEAEFPGERLAARLDAIFAENKCTGRPASFVLADEWVRLFIVTPPQNATRLQDCRAAAAMRFHALYGDAAADWQLEAEWDARLPFLACAAPRALLATVRAVAARHRMSVTQIVPQFIAAWNQWHNTLKPAAWFGVVQSNTLTLGVIDRQRLCAVRSVPMPDSAAQRAQWLAEYVGREALRLNLPIPNHLQLCGRRERHWADTAIGSLVCEQLESNKAASHVVPLSACAMLAHTGVRQ